jgi:hypothetical protein
LSSQAIIAIRLAKIVVNNKDQLLSMSLAVFQLSL